VVKKSKVQVVNSSMNYKKFCALKNKPKGKTSKIWDYFPFDFEKPDTFLGKISRLNVIDDFMSTYDMKDFKKEFPKIFNNYIPFAMLDYEVLLKEDPSYPLEAYSEFFLAVDIGSKSEKIIRWNSEGGFSTLSSSFDHFYKSLFKWELEE